MKINFIGSFTTGYVGEVEKLYVGENMRYNILMRKMPRGKNHYNWKGGKHSDGRGYVKIYKPLHPFNNRGYVLEHRLIMENHIGRYLSIDEVIHHKNGIKNDNRLENLLLMSRNDHTSHHLMGNKLMVGLSLSKEVREKISQSNKNYWKTHTTVVHLGCTNCGKEIIRQQYRLKRSKHHFCSFKCYKEYGTGKNVWL